MKTNRYAAGQTMIGEFRFAPEIKDREVYIIEKETAHTLEIYNLAKVFRALSGCKVQVDVSGCVVVIQSFELEHLMNTSIPPVGKN